MTPKASAAAKLGLHCIFDDLEQSLVNILMLG